MTLPSQIDPCPLIEASADIRFVPEPPREAVFGILYGRLKARYETLERLPSLQLPEEVLNRDPDLTFMPHYRMKGTSFALQLGPSVVALSTLSEYPGWSAYFAEIREVLTDLAETAIIKKIDRIGLRYINFLTENVFEVSTFELMFNNRRVIKDNLHIRTTLPFGAHPVTIQATNHAYVKGEPDKRGSIIDLDASVRKPDLGGNLCDATASLFESLHSSVKECFFSSLRSDFLERFSPTYD